LLFLNSLNFIKTHTVRVLALYKTVLPLL